MVPVAENHNCDDKPARLEKLLPEIDFIEFGCVQRTPFSSGIGGACGGTCLGLRRRPVHSPRGWLPQPSRGNCLHLSLRSCSITCRSAIAEFAAWAAILYRDDPQDRSLCPRTPVSPFGGPS